MKNSATFGVITAKSLRLSAASKNATASLSPTRKYTQGRTSGLAHFSPRLNAASRCAATPLCRDWSNRLQSLTPSRLIRMGQPLALSFPSHYRQPTFALKNSSNVAHRIIYKPQGIILSSALGDIPIAVEGDYVDVLLTSTAQTILSERYYAYSGTVTLYDLASLIEAEMRSSGLPYADFTLRVFSDTTANKADTCTLHILYCDRYTPHTDVPTFLAENFLTTLPIRRVATAATVSLFFFARQGESLEYTLVHNFRKKDNADALYSHEYTPLSGRTASSAGVEQINISVAEIIADAASFATARLSEIEPLSFTVRCGQRSVTFFIDPLLDTAPSFYFRNCFNVWDWATLPAVTTAKSSVERSTAVINGTAQFYNQSATKSYEVEAGPLTSDEADWIDQLLTSYDVFRIEPDATNPDDPFVFAPILITDATCETNDGDTKLNSVKFTWRYADNRPVVRLSASPGIFTSPYNIVFS